MKKKLLLVMILVALGGILYQYNVHQYLSLEGIKQVVSKLQNHRQSSPWLIAGGFATIYILLTLISFPGATVLTLGAGALFGTLWGTVIVSFASTIGATLAFLSSRYLLHNWVQHQFGHRLKTINAGIAKEGGFYLFTLRLVPLFPFFLVNLLMGLTPIRVRQYYAVSQLGMLPGTLVYVNAGTQLAQLTSLSGLLSPTLLLSFALLGLFPIMAKRGIERLKARRVYHQWQKPNQFDRNMVVIGGGAAGLVSAYIAAAVKAKVTLVEANHMGGDCLNYGCVPSKALIQSAKAAHHIKHSERYGLKSQPPEFDFREVMARVHRVIREIEPHDSVERYTALGVDVVQGYAKIIDPWRVKIQRHDGEMEVLTTRNIVIATGAKPVIPPIPGIEDCTYFTSDTMWEALKDWDHVPTRLVVLGGGPIGCELAQSFARLGSQVTLIEMAPRILLKEDKDVTTLAVQSLENDGVTILTAHHAKRCEQQDGTQTLIIEPSTAEGNPQERRIPFDALLCATGRSARLSGFGLKALGIETERTITTNTYLETIYPNIFAAGDVAGPYQFTHTAAHQAWYAAVNALFGDFKKFKVDYSVIPWTTFLDPEIARVGLNEQEALEQGIRYEKTRYDLHDLDRAITDSKTQGFVQVLTAPGKDKILGVTIVGEHAGDLLAEFVLAMKHGLGLNKILGTIHTYPTLSEASKYVAGTWKRNHAPVRLLQFMKWYHRWKRNG